MYGRDQAETCALFELISICYERKSSAITANTPFSQWDEVFVEPAMTLAAIDRLVHHPTILGMNVKSNRLRKRLTQSLSSQIYPPFPPATIVVAERSGWLTSTSPSGLRAARAPQIPLPLCSPGLCLSAKISTSP